MSEEFLVGEALEVVAVTIYQGRGRPLLVLCGQSWFSLCRAADFG